MLTRVWEIRLRAANANHCSEAAVADRVVNYEGTQFFARGKNIIFIIARACGL